jgi:hypothetical protein
MKAKTEYKTYGPAATPPALRFRRGGGFFAPASGARFFTPPVVIQRKLSVDSPGDRYEQEAEAVSELVMRSGGAAERSSAAAVNGGGAHAARELPVSESTYQALNASRSGGRALDAATGRFMSQRFGAGFTDVRIHDDPEAAHLSQTLHAKAFTTGNHIYFNRGQYRPGTTEGNRLLAHELTHVIQQGADGDRNYVQRAILDIQDFDLSSPVDPLQAVGAPEYIDNYIIDYALRGAGSVMHPVFTGFILFYQDGTIFDIPASTNSYFPNLRYPTGQTVTAYIRHLPTGKIFPVTYDASDFLAASDPTNLRTIPNPQFLFLRRAGGTPNIVNDFDNEIVRIAFAYAGLIGQLWNVALGVRSGLQIFQLSGALRVAAAARTGASGAAAVEGAVTSEGTVTNATGASVASAAARTINVTVNVMRSAPGLSSAELAAIQRVETRLALLVRRAIQNIDSGTATGAWAQRLAATSTGARTYSMVLGNAIHEETFSLIQQDVAAGVLPAGIRTNIGRATGSLTSSFGRLRPDIRMPLGGGKEAVFDITTTRQAGHATKYGSFSFVEYISELLY